jgi:SNF2 family DNA or RNA helicase
MLVLKQHQLDGLKFLHTRGALGGLIWFEMGLGKTILSLNYMRDRLAYHKNKLGVQNPKFVVICPKSAGITWRQEVKKNAPDLWNHMILIPVSRIKNYMRYVASYNIVGVIFDESHYAKNPEADRTRELGKFFQYLGQHAPGKFVEGKVVFLTGTPYLNNAGELFTSWAVLTARSAMEAGTRLLSESMFFNWRNKFTNKEHICFTKFDRRKKKTITVDATNYVGTNLETRDEMDKIVSSFTLYRRAEDCLDMPEKNIVPVDLGISDDDLLKDANLEEPEYFIEALQKLATAKTPHAVEWVKEFFLANPDKQLVIFAQFVNPLNKLKEILKDHMVLVTGAETGSARDSSINKFQQGKVKVIGLSYGAGAESINLQNTNYCLYIGYPWTWGRLSQAMARTHRQGQRFPTFHYFLLSGHSDQRVLEKVMTKKDETITLEEKMKLYEAKALELSSITSLDELI